MTCLIGSLEPPTLQFVEASDIIKQNVLKFNYNTAVLACIVLGVIQLYLQSMLLSTEDMFYNTFNVKCYYGAL